MTKNKSDDLNITTIRMLSIDAVERAKSGHPGMPLGAAPMAYVLWSRFLRHNPKNSNWFNRDRFILSAGHGSALLYSLLHLFGYPLSKEDLMNFRQWQSLTPGHPEHGLTSGVEATTGPLGQGFAMGVGMAITERFMRARYNREKFSVIDHNIYAIVSDGDLMEGISSEAASLAGHLGLGKIVYLYDDNKISIEGSTSLAFGEDVYKRFEAYGWHVQKVKNGNDINDISKAIEKARANLAQPSIIGVGTHIGFGSPKQDMASAHGEPLGAEALKATKEKLGWPLSPDFYIPDDVKSSFQNLLPTLVKYEDDWKSILDEYSKSYPDEFSRLKNEIDGKFELNWKEIISKFKAGDQIATRVASGKTINALAKVLPNMIGGSADLAPSNKSYIDGGGDVGKETSGARNLHFGVREHAMAGITNGMALHGGVLPYCSTFLVFSDYMRPSIRLSALMKSHSIFVFTHDSIGVGEDGPTHQPIEHLMALRAIPGFTVIRPADANETAAAWKASITMNGPSALILTRQNLLTFDMSIDKIFDGVQKGAYVLFDCEGTPSLIFIATGSEVHLAVQAHFELLKKGVKSRVVSMPSWEFFEKQDQAYKDSVLPPTVKNRISIEAGITKGWERWVTDSGVAIGIDRYGASAPCETAMHNFGFCVENILKTAKRFF